MAEAGPPGGLVGLNWAHQYLILLHQGHNSAAGSVVVSLQLIHAVLAGLPACCWVWTDLCACWKHCGCSVLFWGKAHGSGVSGAALPCAPSHPQQDRGICLGRNDVKLPHLPSAACPGQGALKQLIPSFFKWPEPLKSLWLSENCDAVPLCRQAGHAQRCLCVIDRDWCFAVLLLQSTIRSYLILRYLVILWLWTEGWEQDKRLEREDQVVMCLCEKWVLKLWKDCNALLPWDANAETWNRAQYH